MSVVPGGCAEPGQNKSPRTDIGDRGFELLKVVGVAGSEPTAFSSRIKRATKLRHTPFEATTHRSPRGARR